MMKKFILGTILLYGINLCADLSSGFNEYNKSNSCFNLENICLYGKVIEQHFIKAKEYFTKACDYDNLNACNGDFLQMVVLT